MRDTTAIAFALITDLTLTESEIARRFLKMSRRWTPLNRGFVAYMGCALRSHKLKAALEEWSMDRWADDGGFIDV